MEATCPGLPSFSLHSPCSLWSESRARSCAVVSSSGQMLGSGLGPEIDSAECVLRMNQAPTMGFEAGVGQRAPCGSSLTQACLCCELLPLFPAGPGPLYVVWGQGKHMDRALGGRTYRALLQLTRMYLACRCTHSPAHDGLLRPGLPG